jgi:hypothetical protein
MNTELYQDMIFEYEQTGEITVMQNVHDLILNEEFDKARTVLETELQARGIWVD